MIRGRLSNYNFYSFWSWWSLLSTPFGWLHNWSIFRHSLNFPSHRTKFANNFRVFFKFKYLFYLTSNLLSTILIIFLSLYSPSSSALYQNFFYISINGFANFKNNILKTGWTLIFKGSFN